MSTATAPEEAETHHLGDDRLDRQRGQRVRAAPFGKALVEYARRGPDRRPDRRPRLDTPTCPVRAGLPGRFFQMGMAERLLMG